MWRKVDLHVHSPASSCHMDYSSSDGNRKTRPEDIVKAALDKGLEGIAITDHNKVSYLDEIEEEARKQGLVIIPGVEISARGGHVLAYFSYYQSPSFWEQAIYSLGIDKEGQGQGSYESDLWLDQVARMVSELGGLAVAAHIDRRPKGFFTSDSLSPEEKKRILSCPYFSALEITISLDKKSWNEGTMPGLSSPMACIQGSDAHSTEEIGRRPLYLDVRSFNLYRIKQALEDFKNRVRFPEEMENRLTDS